MTKARIIPLEPPYAPETETMLKKWMTPGSAVEPLKLFRTLAINPELNERMRPLGAYILGRHSRIAIQERELVIDRTCAVCGSEYEWGVHVAAFGQATGLSPEKLSATANAPAESPVWSERETLLIQMVDQLHTTAKLSPELWGKMIQHWDNQQILELIVTVGWYHTISFVANGLQIELEAWGTNFPEKI
jgi:4-carboxymuconolactone decarboxylase